MERNKKKNIEQTKGGLLPLAALVPAFIAAGKAIGLGALGGGASFGAKNALEAVTRKIRKENHPNKETPCFNT